MLDTVGPELQVLNRSEHPISLQVDSLVVLTPNQDKEATSNLLPLNFGGLSKVSNKLCPFWMLKLLSMRKCLGYFLNII